MPQIALNKSVFKSLDQSIPDVKLNNFYLTENPLTPEQLSLVSRPILQSYINLGSEPIRGFWRQEGSFNNDWLIVLGTTLLRFDGVNVVTQIGTLEGLGYCQFAGTSDKVVIISGVFAYISDGATTSKLALPDDQPAGSVASINGYFVISILNSMRFYWIRPGGATVDALDFASAERTPDAIVAVVVISDELWFLGESSVEVWAPTDDANAPFQRISGRVFTFGCSSKTTTVSTSVGGYPCLIWVSQNKEVVLAQGSPQIISNPSIEEFLRSSSDYRAWSFRRNRNDFYILHTSQGTLVFDLTQGSWYDWQTYGQITWKANLGIQVNDKVYASSNTGGDIFLLDEGGASSDDLLICEVSGFIPIEGQNTVVCGNINVSASFGASPSYTSSPKIEIRFSDDRGFSWSEYYQQTLGLKGDYSANASFRSLGSMKKPGRFIELRFSEASRFRLDYVTYNEY
jgi:hypothetical protein